METRAWSGFSQLFPRLRCKFRSLQDEVGLAEIMEGAGHRIRHREKRGPSSACMAMHR